MKITIRAAGSVTVVELDGSLKSPDDMDIFSKFVDAELESDRRKFLLDMRKVHFINSSGLGRLILASKKITEKKGALGVMNLVEEVDQLFTITRIKEKIPVYTDEKTALEHI
ncbi:MAG: STAS domain-containing protein [Nitrospinae bacterium]|nr:STAS domain-containing protein [Nitrospinota bacterium]